MAKIFAVLAMVALTGCIVVPVPISMGATGPATELAGGTVDSYGQRLNTDRVAAGLVPLVVNPLLQAAAQAHAADMAARNYFSHHSPEGRTHADRARAAGYRYCVLAENIAYGQPTEAAVHTGWMGSPEHAANALNPRVNEYGLGHAGDRWVLLLGRRC